MLAPNIRSSPKICYVMLTAYVGMYFFMAALWNRAGHHIFALWFLLSLFFLSFFPHLISAVADWMFTILFWVFKKCLELHYSCVLSTRRCMAGGYRGNPVPDNCHPLVFYDKLERCNPWTRRQSPYLHKPAIVIVTSFSL